MRWLPMQRSDRCRALNACFIAANGVLVMIPAALFLSSQAAAGRFDASFYAAQAVELLVGAVQLTLMGLNFRDGRRLAGKQCPRAA